MTILCFGKTGQVATALAMLPHVLCLGRDQADLSSPDACAAKVAEMRPDAVINAAAYTAVDKAEAEEDLANVINGDAPGAIARACASLDIPLVHISTDYVFRAEGPRRGNPRIRQARSAHMGAQSSWAKRMFGMQIAPMPLCGPAGWFLPKGRISSRPCCASGMSGIV